MDFNPEASIYLTKISTAVLTLSNIMTKNFAGCTMSPSAMRKIVITMQDLEQSTEDFIKELNISDKGAKLCREYFIHANTTAIACLEKNQFQSGHNFDELITALKLENEMLGKETDFS